MLDKNKIAYGVTAVIVTYNRKFLLAECLEAIKCQTLQPEKIIIVDNASTDDSEGWIKSKESLKWLPIKWLRLHRNEGGAGGFHEGIKAGMIDNAQYLWLMDDDGYPAHSCLEKLYLHARPDLYIGPLVIAKENKFELAFPLRIPGTLHTISTLDHPKLKEKQFVPNLISPFNGVLLPAGIVKKVGLPEKKFFLWGDEVEYTMRIQKAGLAVGLINNALFFHPSPPDVAVRIMFGLMAFNDPPSKIKQYCMLRNKIYIYKKYKGIIYLLAYISKALYYYLLVARKWSKTNIALKGILAGLKEDFTQNEKYL